ncbi:unnamed protein product, partial [Discosporangium mesarthrocarpum]
EPLIDPDFGSGWVVTTAHVGRYTAVPEAAVFVLRVRGGAEGKKGLDEEDLVHIQHRDTSLFLSVSPTAPQDTPRLGHGGDALGMNSHHPPGGRLALTLAKWPQTTEYWRLKRAQSSELKATRHILTALTQLVVTLDTLLEEVTIQPDAPPQFASRPVHTMQAAMMLPLPPATAATTASPMMPLSVPRPPGPPATEPSPAVDPPQVEEPGLSPPMPKGTRPPPPKRVPPLAPGQQQHHRPLATGRQHLIARVSENSLFQATLAVSHFQITLGQGADWWQEDVESGYKEGSYGPGAGGGRRVR